MENYVWIAIAAAVSVAVFLIWIWRGGRQGKSSRFGAEAPAGVLVESANVQSSISNERPSA